MGREIKFRAWDKNKKQMIDAEALSWLFLRVDGKEWSIRDYPKAEPLLLNYENGVLMQFTGLLDKNGKEIYEGDIIKTPYYTMGKRSGDVNKIIVFQDGMFGVNEEHRYQFVDLKSLFAGVESSKKYIPNVGERFDEFKPTFEIIGNIYENPELIQSNVADN